MIATHGTGFKGHSILENEDYEFRVQGSDGLELNASLHTASTADDVRELITLQALADWSCWHHMSSSKAGRNPKMMYLCCNNTAAVK